MKVVDELDLMVTEGKLDDAMTVSYALQAVIET